MDASNPDMTDATKVKNFRLTLDLDLDQNILEGNEAGIQQVLLYTRKINEESSQQMERVQI